MTGRRSGFAGADPFNTETADLADSVSNSQVSQQQEAP
jgi:hypothetical protein